MAYFVIFALLGIMIFILFWASGGIKAPIQCKHCGKMIKFMEPQIFLGKSDDIDLRTGKRTMEENEAVICRNCIAKINKASFRDSCGWDYQDYLNYLEWDKDTKDDRSQFNPTHMQGKGTALYLDVNRDMFCISRQGEAGTVYYLRDLYCDLGLDGYGAGQRQKGALTLNICDGVSSLIFDSEIPELKIRLNYDIDYIEIPVGQYDYCGVQLLERDEFIDLFNRKHLEARRRWVYGGYGER